MHNPTLLLLNLSATWYMVGLIWMVQIVHYNLFDRVGREGFSAYEADHGRLITPIVGVPMLIEIATAVLLVMQPPPGIPRSWMIAGLIMLGLIWLSTALIQVPCHTKLAQGFDSETYSRLVNSNWVRTILWSARGILMTATVWLLITTKTSDAINTVQAATISSKAQTSSPPEAAPNFGTIPDATTAGDSNSRS